MPYTNELLFFMTEGQQYTQSQIISGVRSISGHSKAGYRDVQKALYAMVKAGGVEWNRKMGNAGLYRLLPGATASTAPPLTGGPGAGTGDGGGGAEAPEDDAEDSAYDDSEGLLPIEGWAVALAVKAARRRGTYAGMGDRELRWLADEGYLGLNRAGREWYESE
jgi:hypothetical protein